MPLSPVVPINRLLINNCKSTSVKYIKYAAFPPAPYHTQLGINDAYLTSPLVCRQGNQSHIFLQTSFFSSFLISVNNFIGYSVVQARNSGVTWPPPSLPPSYPIHHQVLQSHLLNLSHLNLSRRGRFLSASTTTLCHHLLPTQLVLQRASTSSLVKCILHTVLLHSTNIFEGPTLYSGSTVLNKADQFPILKELVETGYRH